MNRYQHLILNQQPLAFGSFTNLMWLLLKNGGVDLKYIPRASFVTLASFLSSPLRLYERARLGQLIDRQRIEVAPVFIIGHWRSGTTYLHNLMSLDANFAYVSTLQAWAPELCFSSKGLVTPILERMTPKTRPMDNVKLSLDYPQEEEFSLANISPCSFYHGWYFPQYMKEYFDKFVIFKNISPAIFETWKQAYMKIMKIANLNAENRRLLIKNPTNTGRVKILLDLFPDAKFIHIYRNPYMVYFSTKSLYNKLLPVITLQDFNEEEVDENILFFYKEMMSKFFSEKDLIPPNNLVEVKYEDLEIKPIQELERIYNQLNLTGFDQLKETFNNYVASQRNYKRNTYKLQDSAVMQNIYHHWKFTIEKWQYCEPTF